MRANQNTKIITFSVLFIMCILFVVSTGISCYRYHNYKLCKEKGIARVVDINISYKRSRGSKYNSHHRPRKKQYPVCEFEAEGKTWQFTSLVTLSSVEIGDNVSIYYEAGNPDNAWIAGAGDFYRTSAIITGIVGIAILIGGIRRIKS